MKNLKEKINKAFEALKSEHKLNNVMETPMLEKVIINVGTGSMKDKKKPELVADRLAKITGQKPSSRPAKQSIASFKTRQGDAIGYQVTLRGSRMIGFIEKFLNVALPRTKDFRGISDKGIDKMGNITIGIKEHTIFPETGDEELKDVFGMAITVVTTSKDKETTKKFLEYLGFPFKK